MDQDLKISPTKNKEDSFAHIEQRDQDIENQNIDTS